MKKTKWFKNGEKPVRDGRYELKFSSATCTMYFSCGKWCLLAINLITRKDKFIPLVKQDQVWRGLAEKPE